MFSLRHGISDKPWFLPPDFTGEKPRPNGQSTFRSESEFRGEQAL
jgi:hypothetical protein